MTNGMNIQSRVVTTDNRVGIGTSAPGYPLDVTGEGRFTGNVYAPNFLGNVTAGYTAGGWVEDTGNNKIYPINLAYNVGIGKTTPTAKLDVAGNANISGTATVSMLTVSSLTGVLKGNAASPITAMTGTQRYLAIWASDTNLGSGTIYDNGNVGIGNASPGEKLDVTGNINASGTAISSSLAVTSLTGVLKGNAASPITAMTGTQNLAIWASDTNLGAVLSTATWASATLAPVRNSTSPET